MKKKILCFDLDNVICFTDTKKNYKKSIPYKKVINLINELFLSNKFYIKIYTARGMGKFNGNCKKVKKFYKLAVVRQLKKWSVLYDELVMCKTSYDLLVDDKAYGFKKDWYKKFRNSLI